ncbi:MAG: hypothetical protein JF588_18945 [Caulobacterales bacterium]|nr:hypothetical protein [Caulobacterales bacterium]
MAASQSIEHDEATFSQALDFIRTTVIGGALFLLPIFVVLLVLGKVLGMMVGLTEPLVSALGVTSIGGIAVSNLITIFGVVVLAFVAGLFARTETGQAALAWMREGVSATIPQFSLIHDVTRSVGSDEEVADMPVVLVPTDAGWALGLLLEAEGDWHAVFIPGAPQMSSGSVAYAHTDQIHRTDLTLTHLWAMLRARGKGSSKVYKLLESLQAAGKL